MSPKNLPETNPEKSRRSSLGNLLRATREGRNTSLDEAATVTRISVRILTALEANDFATLPAEVFTRGFIKIYAEYLGLDPSEVLKLFTEQENLDPERPADRPYRRDILFGTAMAHPLQVFKGNPRLRIVAILLATLLCFYAVGAIIKSFQKHPGQDSPENELAKSLVNPQAPNLPGPPGVVLPPLDGSATAVPTGTQAPASAEPGASAAPGKETTPLPVPANIAEPNKATPTQTVAQPTPAGPGTTTPAPDRAGQRQRPDAPAAAAPGAPGGTVPAGEEQRQPAAKAATTEH